MSAAGDESNTALTKNFYEANAEAYAKNTEGMLDDVWLEKFAACLPAGGRVLDAGCAAGRDSAWFVSRGFRTTGVDFTPAFVEMARQRVPGASFHVMDIRSLAFDDDAFDGIWCSCVLIHLQKSEVRRAIEGLWRILAPRGVLYVLVKAGNREGIESDSRYGGMKKFGSYFTAAELRATLSGFDVLEESEIDVPVDGYRATDRLFVLARKPLHPVSNAS